MFKCVEAVERIYIRDNAHWVKVYRQGFPKKARVRTIHNWAEHHTYDSLRGLVVENDWSGFSIGKPGTLLADAAIFTAMSTHLTLADSKANDDIDSTWIRLQHNLRWSDRHFLTSEANRPPSQRDREGPPDQHEGLDLPLYPSQANKRPKQRYEEEEALHATLKTIYDLIDYFVIGLRNSQDFTRSYYKVEDLLEMVDVTMSSLRESGEIREQTEEDLEKTACSKKRGRQNPQYLLDKIMELLDLAGIAKRMQKEPEIVTVDLKDVVPLYVLRKRNKSAER